MTRLPEKYPSHHIRAHPEKWERLKVIRILTGESISLQIQKALDLQWENQDERTKEFVSHIIANRQVPGDDDREAASGDFSDNPAHQQGRDDGDGT